MLDQEQKEVWSDIQDLWNQSARAEEINLQVKPLLEELKGKVGPFEKRAIKSDIEFIKNSTSQFEKDLIERDLLIVTKSLKKFIGFFKK